MKLVSSLGTLCAAQQTCKTLNFDGKAIKGLYFPNQEVNGVVIDYAKCVYPADWDLNWVNANTWCHDAVGTLGSTCAHESYCNGRLASFHTSDQSEQMTAFIRQTLGGGSSTNSDYWIGLRKHCKDCSFAWEDLSPYSYENWAKGEPQYENDEDCVRAYDLSDDSTIGSFGKFTWNDEHCQNNSRFVCQQYLSDYHKPTDKWLPTGEPTTAGCKKGWKKYGGGCYALFGDKNSDPNYRIKLNWEGANAQCSTIWEGATLAIMPNIHYQWFMTSMLASAEGKSRGNPYIGILSNQNDGRDHQFHWVDNTPLEFTNWAKNEPDGKSEDGSIYQTVVEVFSHTHDTGIAGQWIDQTESYERAYMCSHQAVANEIGTGYDECPVGWIQLRHFCYKMFTNPLSFTEAKYACQGQPIETGIKGKGELGSVIDEYEFNLLRAMLYPDLDVHANNDGSDEYPAAWIGLTAYRQQSDTGNPNTGDVIFEWTDKSHFTSTFWAANQPNQNNILTEPDKTCFFMNLPTGAWANSGSTKCATPLPYVCKINIDADEPADEVDTRGELMDCSEGYIASGNRCVKGFIQALNWFDAEDQCQSIADENGDSVDGHLVSIHSESKNVQLTQYFQQISGGRKTPFWAGAQRQGGNSQIDGMMWTDKSDFSYMKWDIGEPSFEWNGHAEDCLSVKGSGYWNDDHCDTDKHGYLCQIPRAYSGCLGIASNETVECGEGSISTERECDVLNCCWNTNADIQCFKPKSSAAVKIIKSVHFTMIAMFLSLFLW